MRRGLLGRVLERRAASVATPSWTYTPQVTLSGTSVTLTTAIPSTVLEAEILFNAAASNTNSQPPIAQIGPAAGAVSSGYQGAIGAITGSAAAETGTTDGFHAARATQYSNGEVITGKIVLVRWDPAEHLWHASISTNDGASVELFTGSGFITLAGSLTDVDITTPGGSATLSGEARVRYR